VLGKQQNPSLSKSSPTINRLNSTSTEIKLNEVLKRSKGMNGDVLAFNRRNDEQIEPIEIIDATSQTVDKSTKVQKSQILRHFHTEISRISTVDLERPSIIDLT